MTLVHSCNKGKVKVTNQTQKLKIQIGDAVFEADGPTEIVEQQFQAFILLLQNQPKQPKTKEELGAGSGNGISNETQPISEAVLNKVFCNEGDYVSLSASPSGPADALLVLLYGFDRILDVPKVTGVTMMKAARKSGVQIPRIDKYMNESAEFVLTGGAKRGKRYSLNNRGIAHAEKVIRALIE